MSFRERKFIPIGQLHSQRETGNDADRQECAIGRKSHFVHMCTHITQAPLSDIVPRAAKCGTSTQSTDSTAHRARGPGQALRCHGEQECPSARSLPSSQEQSLYLIARGMVRRGAVGWDKSCLPHILVTIHQGHLCVMRGKFWSEPWPWHFPLSLDHESVCPAPSAMEAPRSLEPLITRHYACWAYAS